MDLSNLGDPDVKIAGLKLWIHGRQYEEAEDFWDGNWLRTTARCAEGGGSATAYGPILHLSELVTFLNECELLSTRLEGEAKLSCMEPNLRVDLSSSDSSGGIRAVVHLTPDHRTQVHTFEFAIDQSYLPGIITGIRGILAEYAMRGKPE